MADFSPATDINNKKWVRSKVEQFGATALANNCLSGTIAILALSLGGLGLDSLTRH